DEAQVHALAQLVGIVADEEYPRDVRLDDLDGHIGAAVSRGIAQERADIALLVVGEREHPVDRHRITSGLRRASPSSGRGGAHSYSDDGGTPTARSAVGAAGKIRLPAGCEDARLLDPVLALDASLEVEDLADALDVGARP